MKAIQVHFPGPPSVMQLQSIPDPQPRADEVVVAIHAAGVNPVDTYIRSGKYLRLPAYPYVPGNDGAGVIVAVGSAVSRLSVGERVYLTGTGLGLGAYAQFAAYPASNVARMPTNLTYEQAAAVNVPYATAYRALYHSGRLRAGDKVLIHGASGGVGLAAVQMAVAAGAQVFATAGTERGMQLIREQGAHHCFNHRSADYMRDLKEAAGGGVELIVENLASTNLDADLSVLGTFGRVVVVGSRGRIEIDPRTILQKDAIVCGMALWNASPEELADIHAALFAGLSNASLRPVVGRRYDLADAALAHEAVLENGAYGKIVLQP